MKRLLVVSLLLFGRPGFAQESDQLRMCSEKATTQADMTRCAVDERMRVDTLVGERYRRLLKEVTDEGAVEKIKAAEGAWVLYRDAFVEAMFPAKDKQAEYGSSYVMDFNLLRVKLGLEHLAALEALLAEHGR